MAWPPPNPGGVNLQFIAEAQQIINSHNQHHQPHSHHSFTPATGGHAPITNDEIESEAAFNAQFNEPGRSTLDYDVHTGVGSSSGGYGAHRLPGQSPQAGGSGSGSKAEAPSKSTLETRKSLQARGKNWHSASGDAQGRAWEERQRRDEAVSILESEEMLMWIAGVRNEVCLFCPLLFFMRCHAMCCAFLHELNKRTIADSWCMDRVYHKRARFTVTSSLVSNNRLRIGTTSGKYKALEGLEPQKGRVLWEVGVQRGVERARKGTLRR